MINQRNPLWRFAGVRQTAWLFFLFLYLPIVVLVALSFNAGQSATLWAGFSLKWFAVVANDPEILRAAQNSLLVGISVVIISVLLPKRVISSRAQARLSQIDDELSLFVQMLRILFDSGLAVEQALRVLAREAGHVMPELIKELEPILRRAEQGLDLENELGSSAALLDHVGFTDVTVIIRQMLKQGGSARASLTKLIEVMESRRLTDKMTVVMIVFFFPALVILLAGPGFISIGDSLGNM